MPVTTRHQKIDEVMEKAATALARRSCFEAERMACKALCMAQEDGDLERMARIVQSLQDARRQRLRKALDVRSVKIISQPVTDDTKVKRGCYLIRPPQVGADARRLRLIGLRDEVPLAVVCCEPTTRLGLCPIVAITPGFSVRTRIDPPSNPERPSVSWLAGALEALGDSAIENLDSELEPRRRVEALLLRLDAVPEHDGLHQALVEACHQACRAAAAKAASVSKPRSSRRAAAEGGAPS